jgi:hypothetical protein
MTGATEAWHKCFDGDPVLTKLRAGSNITDGDIAALADKLCRFFARNSPFAFVNDTTRAEQRFIALWRGRLFRGSIYFAPSLLPDQRDALIKALRRRGRVVSDFGAGQLMPPEMKALYRNGPGADSMGLDLPTRLKSALIADWTRD